MRARSCPSHPDAMDALCVAAADGGSEIEIDRCGECGALWFDAGELEVVANLHARPSPAESEHPCPVCRLPMRGASLPRGLFAHRCDTCRGTFLDGKTVTRLQTEKLPRPPDQRPKSASGVGFICARCGGKFPYAQGNGTSKGLVCGACVINPQVEKIRQGPTSTYAAPGARSAGLDFDFADLVDSLSSLFRR